jgi:hypothetical protein
MNSYRATLYKGKKISKIDLLHENINHAAASAEFFGKLYDCDKVKVQNIDPKRSIENEYIVKQILK